MIDRKTTLYFFGTSYTLGGPGWLFQQPEVFNLPDAYPHLPTPTMDSMSRYSFPGALQNLFIENNINFKKFVNLAKEGFGLERIIREIYSLLLHNKFNKENDILFIELSDNLYRRDLYFSKLKDYIIGNHHFLEDGSLSEIHYAHTWHQDNEEIRSLLDFHKPTFEKFHTLTFDRDEVLFNAQNATVGLISMLNAAQIKYFLTSGPYFVNPELLDLVNFNEKLVIFEDLEKYIKVNKLTFADQTNSTIMDTHHAGIEGNKLIAQTIYDFLLSSK